MNKRKIWKIFDSTVKILFSEPQYLVQFLQAVLPPALVKSTDWNAVSVLSELLPDSSGMSERPIYADLIVQLPQVGDAPEKICSIIEIKSDDVRGYEKQLSDYSHSAQRKHPQCELIACVLFYCGRKPWNPSEQTGLSEGLGPARSVLVNKRIIHTSVHSQKLVAKTEGGLKVGMIALREMPAIATQAELWQFVDEVVLPVLDEDRQIFKLLVKFGLQMIEGDIDEEQIEQYIDDVEGGHEIMTIAENLVMRGESLGIERGRTEGERLGIEKGERLGIEKGELRGIKKGERLGIERGERRGIEKERLEVAQRMLANELQQRCCARSHRSKHIRNRDATPFTERLVA